LSEAVSSAHFYADIKSFDDFSRVAEAKNYTVAPDDWYVVIADIEGSTRAIGEGRYKEVNMIGAACINAVLNICEQGEIPYVFGGDGATLLASSHRVDACKKTLLAVRHLAETKFNLSLRVGVVPVSRINGHGRDKVKVGKYQISPGNVLATFSGGGIERAERWIKSDPSYLVDDSHGDEPPDLSGLSCRWEPLASENGVMLSILVQVTAHSEVETARIYHSTLDALGKITADANNSGKPISETNAKFRWPPRGLSAEIDATVGNHKRFFWAIRLYLYSLIQWALDRFDLTAGGYSGKTYRVELRSNTDYRRFDDTLRILLDCTLPQADEIDVMLGASAERGELRYGLHRADSALMTCLVFNLEKGQHIHFVDGSDGGFTSAAKEMKSRPKN
jgi:hypothetical protein